MADEWIKVFVDSAEIDVDAVDEALERTGLRDVAHDGEVWRVFVVCDDLSDLVATRLALPEGTVGDLSREDLHIELCDANYADLARKILRETHALRGDVQGYRTLRVYLRHRGTLRRLRAEIAARVPPERAAVVLA